MERIENPLLNARRRRRPCNRGGTSMRPLSSTQLSHSDPVSAEFSVASSLNSRDGSTSIFRPSERSFSEGTSTRTMAKKPRRSSFRTSSESLAAVSDMNPLKFDRLGLYGREDELEILHRAYGRLGKTATKYGKGHDASVVVVKDGHPEQAGTGKAQEPMNLVHVAGHSGTGKSAIVEEFCAQCSKKDKHTIFVSGKFDQYLSTPYAPFISAFTQLCPKVLSHDLFNSTLKEEIMQVFGGRGTENSYELLLDLIPNIGELVYGAGGGGGSPASASCPVGDVNSSEVRLGDNPQGYQEGPYDIVKTERKFKFLLQRFLATVCKPEHKVVLFLDDVQWIEGDTASLNLLEMILTNPALHESLLVICSYRDNEVNEEHPFSKRMKRIQETRKQRAEELVVGNLPLPTVHSFITNLFNLEPAETEDLAKIAHKKVQGNVFFLIQFITALRDAGVVRFDIGKMKWSWDESEIRRSTVVAENVLAILMEKMEKLPRRLKRILQIAACLGGCFDEVVITIVARKLKHSHLLLADEDDGIEMDYSTNDTLEDIVQIGLLESIPRRSGNRSYCFAHDQIELAANALLDEGLLPELKLKIGRILYENRESIDYQSLLFLVVDMWNVGSELVTEREQVQLLIKLNHEAGKRAMESSAFEASTIYLRRAIDLIPKENRWDEHYSLSLELYNSLIKAEYSSGSWGLLRETIEIVLSQENRPVLDKQVAYSTMITMLVVEHDHATAIDFAVDVLAKLGTRFRPQLGLLAVVGALIKTKKLVSKIPLDNLLDQVEMDDPIKNVAIDMLSALNPSLYAANPELLLCTVLKMLRWSLKYGLTRETPKCIGFYAMLEMAMGNPKSALNSANLALKLAEKQYLMNSEYAPISAVYGFILPWTRSLHTCKSQLLTGYNVGLQNGDLQYAFINVTMYCFFCFCEGKPLVDLEANMRDYARQMKECNQSLQLQFLCLTWQTVLNLIGRCDNPLVLSGEVMSQDDMLQAADDDNNPALRAQLQCHRLQLAVIYRDFKLAGKLMSLASGPRNIAAVNPGSVIIWRTALFEGVAAFELVRQKQKKWKSTALQALAKVKKWVDGGNLNCVHIMYLLQAEKAAMEKDIEEARELFNRAIATAARNGFRNDRALASERCSDMYFHIGDTYWAKDYSQKAHEAYEEMEAFGKLDRLSRDNSSLRPDLDMQGVEKEIGQRVRPFNATDAATYSTPHTGSTLVLDHSH